MIFTILYFVTCFLWSIYALKKTDMLYQDVWADQKQRILHLTTAFVVNFVGTPIAIYLAFREM